MGANLIVGCRDAKRGEEARLQMLARVGLSAADSAERCQVLELDLSRRDSVRAFARAVLHLNVPISILVLICAVLCCALQSVHYCVCCVL